MHTARPVSRNMISYHATISLTKLNFIVLADLPPGSAIAFVNVVKAIKLSCWRPPNLTIRESKTPRSIDVSFVRFISAIRLQIVSKNNCIRLRDGVPHIRDI
jgi:hypothetical protein